MLAEDLTGKLSGKVIVGMGGPGRVRLNVRWLSLKVRLGKRRCVRRGSSQGESADPLGSDGKPQR